MMMMMTTTMMKIIRQSCCYVLGQTENVLQNDKDDVDDDDDTYEDDYEEDCDVFDEFVRQSGCCVHCRSRSYSGSLTDDNVFNDDGDGQDDDGNNKTIMMPVSPELSCSRSDGGPGWYSDDQRMVMTKAVMTVTAKTMMITNHTRVMVG